MSRPNFVRIIVKSWRQLLLMTLMGLVLALAFSLVQTFQYSSSVKLLITQTNPTGLDPYTAIKSTERIAQNLSEIVYTTAFFDLVVSDEGVDATAFPEDEIDKRKAWRETIETSVSPGTGIMTITAYNKDRNQATILAVRTANQLAIQAPNYFGFSVRVQVIDAPLPSRFFARPDFARNGMFGAIAGLLLGLTWVLWKVRE
jgi:capsular polysaccharide biosynthesis protein